MRHGTSSGLSFRERKDMREAGGVGALPLWKGPSAVMPGQSFCLTATRPTFLDRINWLMWVPEGRTPSPIFDWPRSLSKKCRGIEVTADPPGGLTGAGTLRVSVMTARGRVVIDELPLFVGAVSMRPQLQQRPGKPSGVRRRRVKVRRRRRLGRRFR